MFSPLSVRACDNLYFQPIPQNGHSGALGVLVHNLVVEVKEAERETATSLMAHFPSSRVGQEDPLLELSTDNVLEAEQR